MKSILILAAFVILLQPWAASAETPEECRSRCSSELTSAAANCPQPGEEGRARCIQDVQASFKLCNDNCQQAAAADKPADAPKDKPSETSPDTPDQTPADTRHGN